MTETLGPQEEGKVQPNLELGKQLETRQLDMKFITLELNNALVAYLETQPYKLVANLINSLSQSPIGKANIQYVQGN